MVRKGGIIAVTEKEFKNAFEGTDREVVYENDEKIRPAVYSLSFLRR